VANQEEGKRGTGDVPPPVGDVDQSTCRSRVEKALACLFSGRETRDWTTGDVTRRFKDEEEEEEKIRL